MTATAYTLGLSNGIADLAVALTAKGLITTNYYQAGDYLVFSSPIMPNKVIKIDFNGVSLYMYYGDAWTSTYNITNPVEFCKGYNYCSALTLIADTTWFFIGFESGTNSYYTYSYIGALDNGDVVVFGLTSSTTSTGQNDNVNWNFTKGVSMKPVVVSGAAKDAAGHIMTSPLMWASALDDVLIMNGVNPAATLGVKNAIYKPGPEVVDKGAGYFISSSELYDMTQLLIIPGSLLVEYVS